MSLPFQALRLLYRSLPDPLGSALLPARDFYLRRRHEREADRQHKEDVRQLVTSVAPKLAEAARPYQRKLLIDGGFNNCLVMDNMVQQLKGFQFYGFEVNREYFEASARRLQTRHPNILAMNFQAVSDHDGPVLFRIAGERQGPHIAEGTTILPPGQLADMPESDQSYSVDAVDFSRWLREIFLMHSNGQPPYVAVKMDIEGAEYEVLEKMVRDRTIHHVNDLIVEFHARRFDDAVRPSILRREKVLKEQIAAANVRLHEWI